MSPAYRWDWPHLTAVQTALNRVTAGLCDRLMIFMPPRHGKSEMVTVRYPLYRLETDPTLRVIIGAYNQTLADKFSRKMRRLATGRLALAQDRQAVEDWETTAGGGVRAVGVGGGITGQGGDLIIIDDPVKSRDEAESAAYRERVAEWFSDDLYTRQEPGAAIILIMTLWHTDDLGGRLLSEMGLGGDQWDVVRLPALAEPDDPLGRSEGAALCPERFDTDALARIRAKLGERSFMALYQQRPRPAEGALFKREWFHELDIRPGDVTQWVRFWDLAVSTKQGADYTAGALVGQRADGHLVIADVVRGRWEWPDARKVIASTAANDPPGTVIGVEQVAFQLAGIQDLLRDPALLGHVIRAVVPDKDKYARALPWASRAEQGLVQVVRGPWLLPWYAEISDFPQGQHDDQVDAVSGGVGLLGRAGPLHDYGEESFY